MAKTREQLIEQVAEELKILGAGQVLAVEDHDKIDDTIDPVMAMLSRKDLLGGIRTDAIPDEFFIPVARIIANDAAMAFGFTGQELADTAARALDAERQILAMTLPRATGQTAQADYM